VTQRRDTRLMPLAVPLLDRARALPVPLPALVRQAPDPPRTGEAATGVRSRPPETRLTGCCCRSDFTPPLRCSRPPNARAIGVEAGAARGRRDRAEVHTFFILVCRFCAGHRGCQMIGALATRGTLPRHTALMGRLVARSAAACRRRGTQVRPDRGPRGGGGASSGRRPRHLPVDLT
jgi:hypothetical protein